jgi:dTDP-4-dehydrorhamnose 3,5-epimerase-like enzyme
MLLKSVQLVELPLVSDERGNLTFIESARHVPFSIERVYYLYDVPRGVGRGGHAHKALRQLMVPLSGAFEVVVDDGRGWRERYRLDRPNVGLYIGPMIWRELESFSPGAVALVLASKKYDESDYYRNYDAFAGAVGVQ